jgi:hypothetical protein
MDLNGELNFDVDLNTLGDGSDLIQVDVPAGEEVASSTEKKESQEIGTDSTTSEVTVDVDEEKKNDPNLIEIPDVENNQSKETGENKSGTDPAQNAKASDSPTDNKIATLAKALTEQGVLSELPEEFDGSVEGLLAAMGNEVKNGVEAYKESLPPAVRKVIDNYEEGVPLDKVIENQSRQFQYKSITAETIESNIELQKRLVAQDLINRGYSEEKIAKRLEMFENSETLLEEAKDAHGTLVQAEEYREEQMKAQAREQAKMQEENNRRTLEDIRNSIDSAEEIVPGMKLNKTSREKLYKSLTSPVGKDANGNPMNAVAATRAKDVLKFETTLHYLHQLGVFDGDWSKLNKVAKSNATSELKAMLENTNEFNGTSSGTAGNAAAGKTGSVLEGMKIFNK